MRTVRPPTTLGKLRQAAQERTLVDYEATRRARAQQEAFLQFADWQPLTPQNGWETNTFYGSTGPAIYRDRAGFVHLRGHVKHTGGTPSTPIVTLPPELVAQGAAYFAAPCYLEAPGFAPVLTPVIIAVTTVVYAAGFRTLGLGTYAQFLSLDSVVFQPANAGLR